VSGAIRTAAPAISGALFTVVLTMFGLAVLDWRFLVVLVVVLPVHYAGARMFLRDAPPIYRQSRVAMGERAHHVLGSIRGLPTVHAFGLGPRLAGPIDEHSWWVARWELRARIVVNRLFGRINLAEFFGMASILLVGFWLVDRDLVTVGVTTTAMLFFLRLFGPLGQLLLVMDDLQSGLASLSRIAGLIDECEDTDDPGRARPRGRELRARDVRFGYDT
ncbi:ABC transporter transmembrane domain-containing protein, partial [Rhodococcus chondri]